MGDRGNIVVREGKDEVWFYSHWSGSSIGDVVKEALSRRQRWDDAPYLARIVFDTLTQGEHGGETGFGIWNGVCDNEHDIVVVDVAKQKVEVYDAGNPEARGTPLRSTSFEAYAFPKVEAAKSEDPAED